MLRARVLGSSGSYHSHFLLLLFLSFLLIVWALGLSDVIGGWWFNAFCGCCFLILLPSISHHLSCWLWALGLDFTPVTVLGALSWPNDFRILNLDSSAV